MEIQGRPHNEMNKPINFITPIIQNKYLTLAYLQPSNRGVEIGEIIINIKTCDFIDGILCDCNEIRSLYNSVGLFILGFWNSKVILKFHFIG